jgi:hypothetical protein
MKRKGEVTFILNYQTCKIMTLEITVRGGFHSDEHFFGSDCSSQIIFFVISFKRS